MATPSPFSFRSRARDARIFPFSLPEGGAGGEFSVSKGITHSEYARDIHILSFFSRGV
jgi:hypothetical protein